MVSDSIGDARFRTGPVRYYPGPDGWAFAYSLTESRAVVIPCLCVAILRQCEKPATINEHAARFLKLNHLDSRRRPEIISLLNQLEAQGLLISDEAVVHALTAISVPRSASVRPVERLFLLTKDRPHILRRCLSSMVASSSGFLAGCHLTIVDDSGIVSNTEEASKLLGSHSEETPSLLTSHVDRQLRRALASDLALHGCSGRACRFALLGEMECCGSTITLEAPGSARNTVLLLGARQRVVMMDDDHLCGFTQVDRPRSLSISGEKDPREVWFFATEAERERCFPLQPADFLFQHGEFLGQPVAECIGDHSRSVITDELTSDLLQALAQDSHATVRITQLGCAGDPGTGASSIGYFLTQKGSTHERLVRSQTPFPTLLLSREVVRMAPHPTISRPLSCMTGNIGVDVRGALPPFLPIGRGEDYLWGVTIAVCDSAAYTAHLPLAQEHRPPVKRTYSDRLEPTAGRFALASLLRIATLHFRAKLRTVDGTERVMELGSHFLALAALNDKRYHDFWAEQCWIATFETIRAVSERLAAIDASSAPASWREWVAAYMKALEDSLNRRDRMVPLELKDLSLEDGDRFMRALLRQYGELLMEWPNLQATYCGRRFRGA